MTLQQMEYVLAVDRFRHFAKAAEHCRVTQPTLSAMIQKLEEELGTKYSTGDNNRFVRRLPESWSYPRLVTCCSRQDV